MSPSSPHRSNFGHAVTGCRKYRFGTRRPVSGFSIRRKNFARNFPPPDTHTTHSRSFLSKSFAITTSVSLTVTVIFLLSARTRSTIGTMRSRGLSGGTILLDIFSLFCCLAFMYDKDDRVELPETKLSIFQRFVNKCCCA